MATNVNWPYVSTQVAMDSGFSTPGSPHWADLSLRQWSMSCSRGRQYELDQTQAGVGAVVLADKDEYLNPTNPASPWAGNVLPYRQICCQAMWPPLPVGSAVNLLNTSGQTSLTSYDMTFESYTPGVRPVWAFSFGGVNPIVTTTTPFQGAQCLTWNVTNGGGLQGLAWNVALVPGVAYTVSAYVRQSVANQLDLWVNGHAAFTASTSTTGAYVRLALSFVADQPQLQLCISSLTPTLTGTVNVDAIQLERVAALNATPTFSTGLGAWAAVNNATLAAFARSQVGTASLRVTPDGVTAVPTAQSEEVAVAAGLTYALYGVLQSTTTATRTLNIAWYNASHALLSTSAISQTATGGQWTVYGWAQFVAPASSAFARVTTTDPGTPAAGNPWYVDQAFLLPVAPATFNATGPVIYGVHRGYVERWPSSWLYRGMYGKAEVTTVDAFAALAARKLHTEWRNAVLAKSPTYYWSLSDAAPATSFTEQSGNNGPRLFRYDATEGPAATFTPGTTTGIPGNPSFGGVLVDGMTTFPIRATSITTGNRARVGSSLPFGTSGATWGISIAFWGATSDTGVVSQTDGVWLQLANNVTAPSTTAEFSIDIAPGAALPPNGVEMVAVMGGGSASTPRSTAGQADGLQHLYVGTFQLAANTWTMSMYLDGTLVGTATGNATTTFGASSLDGTTVNVEAMAQIPFPPSTAGSLIGGVNGTLSELALWNRALSAAEVTDLARAGAGYPGEGSGARVGRYLGYGYTGRSAVDTGMSTMGVSTLADKTVQLDACQGVTLSENGNFWADGTGSLTFFARSRRYLATVPVWTFGENATGGEQPYEEGIAFDFDATLVYNDVQVTRSGGAAPATAGDTTSQASYGPRSYQRTVNITSDNEAVDAANWILATHKDAHQRVATLTIRPSANPALWPVALGAEIGQRVTVKRYTLAGYTMAADFLIEQINHDQKPGEWAVSFQMSPAIGQPGIFDDATYGLFDQTFVFAY